MTDTLIIINIIVSALSPLILSLSFCLKRFKKSRCRDCEVETESEGLRSSGTKTEKVNKDIEKG